MIHIFQSMVIRKGDGNYGLFGGGMQSMRYPPPEAMVDDPNVPDVPAFAHTGAHGEQDSGVPGVGHLIPGDWTLGKHGEMVYKDKSGGEHMHGLDGVIRAVGDSMLQHGLNVPAKDIVQKAIELHNQDHPEKLPHVDDPAWRKTHLGPYQGKDHKARSNFGPNGELITATTNMHGDKHAKGTFLESYSVPFNKQLGQSMSEAGHPNPEKHNWVKYPYIKPYRLHLIPDPENPGQMKPGAWHIDSGQLTGGDILPQQHMDKWDIGHEPAYNGITSWGTVQKLPDVPYSLPHNTGGKFTNKRPALIREAVHQIKQALGHDPSVIGTLIHQTVKPSDVKGELNGKPLSYLLSSDAGIHEIATTLAQYPRFGALFGESRMPKFDEQGEGTHKGSVVGRAHHGYSIRYGDDVPEEQGLEHFMSHTTRVGIEHQLNRKSALHARARSIQANDLLAATAGIDHRTDNLTPEEVVSWGLPLQDTPETREAAPAVSANINAIASMVALATGHKVMEPVTQEEAQRLAPMIQNRLLGGTSDDPSQMGVPEYMRYIEAPQQASVATQPSALPPGKPTGVAGSPVATHALPLQGGAPAATVAPPPPPPPPPRPVAVTPGLTPFQQARERFAQAPMEDVRATMGEAGIRLPQDDARAQQHMQGFQSAMGDPYQRFLSEYTKSADNPEKAQDRLIKAIEILQLEDAKEDDLVKKYVPIAAMNRGKIEDVRFMAERMDITPLDVETILHSKGDWERITKTYGYSGKVVKVVKVSFGGI